MSNTPKEVTSYLNKPQMIACAANTRVFVGKMGRRLGKSEGPGSYRTARPAYMLKGSSGFIAGKSFAKLLDHMLPGILSGWAKFGFVEGEDYVVCKTPPAHFKRPLMPPQRYDHYISFKWGSGIHLISFDHTSTSNALTTDWGLIDEAKQIDPDRVRAELFKTMNGHRSVRINDTTQWGDLPEHLMLTVLSDAYIGKHDFKWIDDFKKDTCSDAELYKLLLLVDEVQKTGDKALERYVWELQKKYTYYMEAGTEENLALLGIDYFRMQARNSKPLELRTSLFNEDVKEIEGGFYPLLDESIHSYTAKDYNRIELIGISKYLNTKQKTCVLDTDLKPHLPIKLAVDYGSTHSWCVAQQKHSNIYWTLKQFWSDSPKTFADMISDFCDYYEPHRKNNNTVELYDDPAGHKKNTEQKRDVDKVIATLRHRGWKVVHKNPKNTYIPHRLKYRIWEKVLDERPERDQRFPKYRHNINNAYEAYYSMSKAPIKLSRKDEFEKDKDSERDTNLPQWKATHLSDCVDMPMCYDNVGLIEGGSRLSF